MPTAHAPPEPRPLGDAAIEIVAPPDTDPEALRHALAAAALPGVRDAIAGTRRVVLHLDPVAAWHVDPGAPSPAAALAPAVAAAARDARAHHVAPPEPVVLPACYDGDCAPDLADVAARTGLAPDEVIARHLAARYVVGLVGFLPGFAYLHGLDPALALPRRGTPRARVPAGSVGVAERMTGVYPGESPGGWHLIARVPLPMFDAHAAPPARLARGATVRFTRIDREAHDALARAHPRRDAPASHDAPAALLVEKPGLLTTVQDAGRWGVHAAGVGQAGWFDDVAPRVANALVGNREDAAVLECTLAGPTLVVARDALVALAGADMSPTLDGVPVAMHRPLPVRAGQRLALGGAVTGCRTYLAIDGGIDVPPTLGSASTQLRGAFGGHAGRALRPGDALATGAPAPVAAWLLERGAARGGALHAVAPPREFATAPVAGARLGLLVDAHAADAIATAAAAALPGTWTVAHTSDRMGLRLTGPRLHVPPSVARVASEPTVLGTVQLPPDGEPIVLGVDRQVTGGYLVAGAVASVSRAALAQLRPGAHCQFVVVPLERAARALLARERRLAEACAAIAHALHRAAHR